MRIILQDTTDVFPLEIHCLYLCAIPEYFIILSVYQFAEIMLPITGLGQAIIEMCRIQRVLPYLFFLG